MRQTAICPNCQTQQIMLHIHDCAHGIPGTHMTGSERYICNECGYELTTEEAKWQGLQFVLDDE